MSDMLNVAVNIAKQAGDFLKDNFGKVEHIESKGDRDFATNLDREAEKMIVETVKSKFPDHGIIGEEGGTKGEDRQYLWIIDPLDGTHNFMRNINVFGVSIGILRDKKFIAGVVYMPIDNEIYVGEENNGAYKNNKKISVSSIDNLKECSVTYDSSIRYAPKAMLDTLDGLAQEVFNIRMFGSSARHLTYLAEGVIDAVVEFHDRPWDFAGGVAIIQEAGGKLTDLRGNSLSYKSIGYVASNGLVHDRISQFVKLQSGK